MAEENQATGGKELELRRADLDEFVGGERGELEMVSRMVNFYETSIKNVLQRAAEIDFQITGMMMPEARLARERQKARSERARAEMPREERPEASDLVKNLLRRIKSKTHPDRTGNDPEKTALFDEAVKLAETGNAEALSHMLNMVEAGAKANMLEYMRNKLARLQAEFTSEAFKRVQQYIKMFEEKPEDLVRIVSNGVIRAEREYEQAMGEAAALERRAKELREKHNGT